MKEDEELINIRQKKLDEIAKRKENRMDTDSASSPIVVTDSTFDEVVKKNSVVVIDCWAAWCGPCRMIAPIIEELAGDYSGRILFGKLNVDENQRIPTQHQVMSIPTLLVFKNAQLVDRIIGALPKKALEQRLVHYI